MRGSAGGLDGLNLYSRTERVPIMRVASEGTLLLIVRGSMPVIFDRVFRVQKNLSIFNNYPHYKHRLFLCVYPCMHCQLGPFTYISRCSEIFLANSSVLPLSRMCTASRSRSIQPQAHLTLATDALIRSFLP